jgi:cation diffusion facilitator CzcD-associated flavoprotein CzcO
MSLSAAGRRGRRDPSIAIIGAGLGGIATAVLLKRAGFDRLVVFEQSSGPGGTWHDNTYPGAEVDVQSHFYSFSFMPYDWPATHATQAVLKAYIEATIERFGLSAHLRFDTRVVDVAWDPQDAAYVIRTANGEEHRANLVVSAVGLLSNPRYPTWPGLASFEGPKFHSSRWEHEHDLRDRVVAVVGTGSTAAQIVPAIAADVRALYLFQREPGWVFPKFERPFTSEERRRYLGSPLVRRWDRYLAYRKGRPFVKGFWKTKRSNQKLRETALSYIRQEIHDPNLRALVTPSYPFGCKRVVLASTYYAALNRDNVKLVPHAVESVTPKGVVANDVEYEVDVLVMATGFQAQRFLSTVHVTGEGGRSLDEVWEGTPRAFLGVTVPGFPNFFMIYGPNTNGGGSILNTHEIEARMIVRTAKRIRRGPAALDTRRRALDLYVRWIDAQNTKRLSGQEVCHTYYFSPSGRNVTQLSISKYTFMFLARVLPWLGIRPVPRPAPAAAFSDAPGRRGRTTVKP